MGSVRFRRKVNASIYHNVDISLGPRIYPHNIMILTTKVRLSPELRIISGMKTSNVKFKILRLQNFHEF